MQKIQLSIPEPCHENWQDMTPNDQGRFCNSCAKTVVDFSMMTDTEVLNYFSGLTNEKICGRTLPTQLNRAITMPREPKKRLFWYWNYIMMFFMFFSKSNHIKAQTKGEVVTVPIKKPTCNVMMGTMVAPKQVKQNHVISGKVTSTEGNPVSFATIRVISSQISVIADANGVYSINASVGDELQILSTNFVSKRIAINNNSSTVNVQLERVYAGGLTVIVVGGAIVTSNKDKCATKQPEQVIEIKVSDKETNKPVSSASVIVDKNNHLKPDTSFTDNKGSYKIKKIKGQDTYLVKIFAVGYKENEVTIKQDDFNDKNAVKEVYLTKKISTSLVGSKKESESLFIPNHVTLRGNISLRRDNEPLVVVDGAIFYNDISTLNPDDIASINVLKGSSAAAIYGSDANSGILVITTKKKLAEEKNKIIKDSLAKKIINKIADKITLVTNANTIKVYPNPVSRGNSFFIALKLQQTGELVIQTTDITGRIVLQKKVNASSKEFVEKIETDGSWTGGMYFINVFNSNAGQAGKLLSKVSFVVL